MRGTAMRNTKNGNCENENPPRAQRTYLKLAIGPSWDLDDHVQDGLLLVGVEGDVVEGRHGHAILFDVDAVLEGVGGADLADAVRGGGHRGG